ncbi:MAG: polysaccharide biosynthesis/export family protein [Pseudomonadota bacterium]
MKLPTLVLLSCLAATPCMAQETPSAQPISNQSAHVASQASDHDYNLGPGDEIRVSVYDEPNLGMQQRIGANGAISVPLIGDVLASGLTTHDLAQTLEARFREGYLRNPQVSVAVVTYRPFYVIGEVNNPGAFPFSADLSGSSAIATAGGFTRRANRSNIYVRHQGESEEHAYPLTAAVPLAPGDTIRVGQGFLASLTELPLGLLLR